MYVLFQSTQNFLSMVENSIEINVPKTEWMDSMQNWCVTKLVLN